MLGHYRIIWGSTRCHLVSCYGMQDSMAGFFVGLGGISLASLNFVKSAGDIPKFLKTFWNCYCKICTSLLLMLKSNLDELYISHGTSIITLPFIFFHSGQRLWWWGCSLCLRPAEGRGAAGEDPMEIIYSNISYGKWMDMAHLQMIYR